MNPDELADFLRQSLADRKLTGSEKTALADWLAKNVTTDQARGLARHTVFDVARAAVEVVGWLEDVLRVLVPRGGRHELREPRGHRRPAAGRGVRRRVRAVVEQVLNGYPCLGEPGA